MKVFNCKRLIQRLLYATIVLIIFSPVYMYFSHDVSRLVTLYPVNTRPDTTTPLFELQKKKPSGWIELNQISSYGKWAIILSEDWAFYNHEGIDLEQMKTALNEILAAERFRGASTITQQMVKNVYLADQKIFWRKFHEIILTQKIEKILSKQRILEIYLNIIEYGPGIYGIKNASYHYFKKHPSIMTPRESAFLAMLLPSPKKYYISFEEKKLTDFASKRIKAILNKMRVGRIITEEQFTYEISSKMSWEND